MATTNYTVKIAGQGWTGSNGADIRDMITSYFGLGPDDLVVNTESESLLHIGPGPDSGVMINVFASPGDVVVCTPWAAAQAVPPSVVAAQLQAP